LLPVLWDKWYVRLDRGETPTLEELLESVRGQASLLLDVKSVDRRFSETLAAILRSQDAVDSVQISSVFWDVLERLREAAPSLAVHRTVNSDRRLEAFRSLPEKDPLEAGVSIHRDLLSRDLAASLVARRVPTLVWPVNDPTTAHELLEWGVTGLISDSPELLRDLKQGAASEA
jgi:glycerophosphoryl diester phosphodiesterase